MATLDSSLPGWVDEMVVAIVGVGVMGREAMVSRLEEAGAGRCSREEVRGGGMELM